jgi:hypothetical protein
VAVIADEMNRLGCMDARIKALNRVALLGVAFTVKARAGDNLMLHRALDMALPGDVIVVDDRATSRMRFPAKHDDVGATTATRRRYRRRRDAGSRFHRQHAVPRFRSGHQPKGPYKNGPEKSTCRSAAAASWSTWRHHRRRRGRSRRDTAADAAAVCKRAHARHQKEAQTRQTILDGTYDRSAYTEDALRKMGCEVIDAAWSERTAEEKV